MIKISQYKFRATKQVNIQKGSKVNIKIFIITNHRDRVIQKAMSILLEMMYEGGVCFQKESHGFRPNRGCHTALQEIKHK